MSEYKKLLIQQQTYNGTSYTNVGNVVDTFTSYGIVCEEFPFKIFPESKEQAKREWLDEDGEDVYISPNGIKLKAYDLEVKFLYSKSDLSGYETYKRSTANPLSYEDWIGNTMRQNISDFIKFIYGRNTGGSSLMAIYDQYTKTGRRGLYVLSVDNDLFFYNDSEINAIASFKVKFRVTDPVTDVTLTV